MRAFCTAILLCVLLGFYAELRADVLDPYDPFDSATSSEEIDSDKDKSADELIDEALLLFGDERPLDARTKLLKALQKNPKDYRAHMYLAGYYMDEVGHFRLALKYVKQAQALFQEPNGAPPYSSFLLKSQHDQLLYLLAQARLNLDDYQGALDVLDQYASFGYQRDWYPGSRAWILMKLGRIDEAIKVARLGILTGAEPGRTLNMLGILLSMHGEREDSLKVFRQAVQYELSLGNLGRPATPLNNAGEVQDEIFQEDLAESSWLKSTRLPDGCEHVLPSLNLAMLYMDQNLPLKAADTIDAFESCVAQFPLRNGEEHRALVSLMRGRIDLYTGRAAQAVQKLEEALANQQWFGKIGTNQDDMRAAGMIFLAQALRALNHRLKTELPNGIEARLARLRDTTYNSLRAWWLSRRARQVLLEDLNNIEDLYIKNTDSLVDYASLGEILSALPASKLEARIAKEQERDDRKAALPFYQIYLAENYLNHSREDQAALLLDQVLRSSRDRFDDGLRLHAQVLRATMLDPESADYAALAAKIYKASPAALRNYGLPLPVNLVGSEAAVIAPLLERTNFILQPEQAFFTVTATLEEQRFRLSFSSTEPSVRAVIIRANDALEAVNNLNNQVFVEDLK